MPTTMILTRTCTVSGCLNRALKACADCGEARCLDHLLPTIDEHRGTVLHLCPTCMETRNNDLAGERPPAPRLPDVFDVFDQARPTNLSRLTGLTSDRPRVDALPADWLPEK